VIVHFAGGNHTISAIQPLAQLRGRQLNSLPGKVIICLKV
jgi:hypothetical protein